jgi:hypothetical protein
MLILYSLLCWNFGNLFIGRLRDCICRVFVGFTMRVSVVEPCIRLFDLILGFLVSLLLRMFCLNLLGRDDR